VYDQSMCDIGLTKYRSGWISTKTDFGGLEVFAKSGKRIFLL